MHKSAPPSRRRPVIRVFVSSTFSDLKHERNALQRDVFRRLELLCARRQFQFQAIDLRWGVPSEAGLDHRTMRICFEELRRSQEISPQPNFLILLGDRYGWRPLPEEIDKDEYEQLRDAAKGDPATLRLLEHWYPLDENARASRADPARVHVLRSRKPDCAADEHWHPVERALWAVINRAFPVNGMRDRFKTAAALDKPLSSMVRFQASATEQEIWRGALSVPNAREHVLAFFRTIDNLGAYQAERIAPFIDVAGRERDGALGTALEELKTELRTRLGDANAIDLKPHSHLEPAADEKGSPVLGPDGKQLIDVSQDHIKELCDGVYTRLEAIVTRQMDEYWGTTGVAAPPARMLQLEQDEHARFAEERAPDSAFVGRAEQRHRIEGYLADDARLPLVVHGESGCGKTALIARAAQDAQRKGCKPIVRFIGWQPRSSDLRSLLSSLCEELRQWRPVEGPLPGDLNELIKEFRAHLDAATADNRIVLFLDALDQLPDTDNASSLYWLPAGALPEYVKIVVSCLSGRGDEPAGRAYTALERRRLPGAQYLDLDPLPLEDAKALFIDRWLRQAGRTLTMEQEGAVRRRLEKDSCRHPLYLRILFEEARLWRSWDAVPTLGEDVRALLGALFDRLGHRATHGATLRCTLAYIASAKRGLTENEILEVLFQDKPYMRWLRRSAAKQPLPEDPPRIPMAIWSRVRFDLDPYLAEQGVPGGIVMNFYHRQVEEFVRGRFLRLGLERRKRHRRLARYFQERAYSREARQWRWDARALAGLLFHLGCAGDLSTVREFLSSLQYLAARVATGGIHELLDDFPLAGDRIPPVLAEWHQFLQKHAHRLDKYPASLVALASHEGFLDGRRQAEDVGWSHHWLKTTSSPRPPEPDMGPPDKGLRVAVSAALRFPRGCPTAVAPDAGVLFRLETLGYLRVYDVRTMRATERVLQTRVERALLLVCSSDAAWVAVFCESGKADLYQCTITDDRIPSSLTLVSTLPYHLPETENPFAVWNEGALWYQRTANVLSRVLPPRMEPFDEPLAVPGELSSLVFVGGRRVDMVRRNGDTRILDSGSPPAYYQRTDVTTACACGGRSVAVAFSNGTIVVYDVSDRIVARAEIRAGILRGSLGWDGTRLLWFSSEGSVLAWRPGDPSSVPVRDHETIYPAKLDVRPRAWVCRDDGSLLLVSTHAVTLFHLTDGEAGTAAGVVVEELLGGSTWSVLLRTREGRDLRLTESGPFRQVALADAVSGRYVCARDGAGLVYAAGASGTGLVYDPATCRIVPMHDCPAGVNGVAGDDDGGCWLVDRSGDVYFVDERGLCRWKASAGVQDVSGPRICWAGQHLVWYGHSVDYQPGIGPDHARTFVVFQRERRLGGECAVFKAGERLLPVGEGTCQAIHWDRPRHRLVTIWTIEGSDGLCLRVGSVEEFMTWRIREQRVTGLNPKTFVQAALSPEGDWVGVLNVAGELACVGVEDGITVATLATSTPFLRIATGQRPREFWLAAPHADVFRCELKEPT